jgi:hypothetical protein
MEVPPVRSVAYLLPAAALFCAGPAHAGAWTQDKGAWFAITSFDITHAGKGYDSKGRAEAPVRFDKTYVKSLTEYGLTGRLTLFAVTDYVNASAAWGGNPVVKARDFSFEGGARYRVSDWHGVWSVQASYKTAGPFDLSNSIRPDAARIAELRALYGTPFKLFGRDGFADVQVAQRWITQPRPDETAIDLTAGLWFGENTMAMVQSFNTISGGDADPPYSYFRMHKVELSAVRRLSKRWSLQLGGFVSPAGQNSLVEQGVSLSVWTRY